MKYFLGIILAFALILPCKSWASNEIPDLSEIQIGGWWYNNFSAGIDFGLKIYSYPEGEESSHQLYWKNRIRFIYDYENEQYGFLYQPNLRYVYWIKNFFATAVGPEIGWESKTGFEYGASLRIGGLPGLLFFYHEVGYLVNSKKLYYTLSFYFPNLLFHISKF